MSAETTNQDEIVQIEYSHDDYFIAQIELIDLSDFDLDDNNTWLYTQCSNESAIQDLYAWLRSEPQLNIQDNIKCVDTRTFTRPKKHISQMNLKSTFEGLSPPLGNIWKIQNQDMYTDNDKYVPTTIGNKESVPLMLKPSTKIAMNIISDDNLIPEKESVGAFPYMPQNRRIDSFMYLREFESNDLLMNTSQPSMLYTSITSSINELPFINNDTVSVTNKHTIAQQRTHQCNDIDEISVPSNTNGTFLMQDSNNVFTPNETYCVNSVNNTFCKKSIQSDRVLNETFNTQICDKVSTQSSSFNNEEMDIVTLSSTFVTESHGSNSEQSQKKLINNIKPSDTTYLAAELTDKQNSALLNTNKICKTTMHMDTTDLNVTCNIASNGIKQVTLPVIYVEDALDMSFKMPICGQSTPINRNITKVVSKPAIKQLEQPRHILYSMKTPTSLRRELLVQTHQNTERKLNSTYDHIPNDHPNLRDTKENIHISCNETFDMPLQDTYLPCKKSLLMTNQCKNQNECDTAVPVQKKSSDRRFYTFTKKVHNVINKTDNIKESASAEVHPNLDATFCKLLPKVQKKNIHAPRMLSKLPQFLQKSNPNLVSSSLKTASMPGSTGISSIGYIKGSQPNIVQNVEKLLPKKLHSSEKLKSVSEQRLLEVNVNMAEFQVKGTTGSTESIESTQSAHSAPDLDDRLNTYSNSNHNSCSIRAMNIDQLHQIVRMQEESLKRDLPPRLNQQILENTWVEAETDMPSPILKNVIECDEINKVLPSNTDQGMKCSSPISSAESTHILDNDDNLEDNITKNKNEAVIEKSEGSNQVVPKGENKTRLRQPTNWAVGSKSAVLSGIPRPATRIPALRFVRPNVKTTKTDPKKECT